MIEDSKFNVNHSRTDERGMALVTALLILVALTALALTAMTNATIDTKIAGNKRQSQQKFYAIEGAEELALAMLPDLISGQAKCYDSQGNPTNCNDQYGNPITTIDQLLTYDGDGDTLPDGMITTVVNASLNTNNCFSAYCQAPAPLSYAVLIQDDADGDNDPYLDSNNQVLLTISLKDPVTGKLQTDPKTGQSIDLIRYALQRLKIKHDGAVNLMDKPNGVHITMDNGSKVDGGTTGKEGIVTTDMHPVVSMSKNAAVSPNGVVTGFDPYMNPNIKDLNKFATLLRSKIPLYKAAPAITLTAQDVAQRNVLYVQGDVTIAGDLGKNVVLFIEDYQDTSGTPGDYIGLTIKQNVHFDGLILLYPRNDAGSPIQVFLEGNSTLEGAMIASSVYDPSDQQSSPGIDLRLGEKAKIKYDYSKIASTGFDRQFAVLHKAYLSN